MIVLYSAARVRTIERTPSASSVRSVSGMGAEPTESCPSLSGGLTALPALAPRTPRYPVAHARREKELSSTPRLHGIGVPSPSSLL